MPKPQTGELAGNVNATQVPFSVECKMVKFKAKSDNAGLAYIGAVGITVPDEVNDQTAGWPLAAGAESPWIPCENTNQFYYRCANAGDALSIMYWQ